MECTRRKIEDDGVLFAYTRYNYIIEIEKEKQQKNGKKLREYEKK